MTANRLLRTTCCALSLLGASCAEVSYTPLGSHDEVLRTRERAVRGDDVEVRAWQTHTELRVQARWRCDLVEWNEIKRTTVEEPDVDYAGDVALLGLSTVPTGFGIALLADSGNVYDNDRNGREYNPAGPTGAIAGGVVLLALGTVMMVVPAVDLGLASSDRETEEIVEERGTTRRRSIACPEPEPAAGVVVTGLLRAFPSGEATSYELGTTDELGRLVVDLAAALPPHDIARADPATALEVRVGNAVAGHADLGAVRDAHRQRLREQEQGAWFAADPEACVRTPSEQSCQGVRGYLEGYPDGSHAAQARAALDALGSVTMVEAEAPPGPDDEATVKARDEIKAVCARACNKSCQRRVECVERCVAEVCP